MDGKFQARAVVVNEGGEAEITVETAVSALANHGAAFRAVFRNGSPQPVRLRRIVVAEWRVTCAGDPSAWRLSTLGDAFHAGLPAAGERCAFVDLLALYADGAGCALTLEPRVPGLAPIVGFVAGAAGSASGPQADVRFECRSEGEGVLAIRAVSLHSDIVVGPGESRESEEVWLLAQPYAEAVDTLMARLARTHGARLARGPRCGWCSWYHKGKAVTADDVIGFADHAATIRERLPLQVIQIDDGFQRAYGDWRLNEKFPDGWGPVLERIRRAGAEPGIWLAPLCVDAVLPLHDEHPDWFQRDAAGKPLGQHLDPTHPGAQAFIRELILVHRRLGFTYFKFDFNIVHEAERFHDPTKTRLQVLRDLFRLYREAVGEEAYLLACLCHFSRAVAGIADALRIGVDSMAVWRESHGICVSRCVQAVGATIAANGVLFVNDPDVTYTWPHRLTDAEWRTWHSFVGLLGGTAMISEPLHVGGQDLGRVRCSLSAAGLQVHAEVNDVAPRENETMPWEGSCVEVFLVGAAGALRQFFLLSGRALRSADGRIVAAPEVACRRTPRVGGYTLDAMIPVAVAAASVRAEVRVYATADPRYGLAYATLFDSRMPYQQTASYGEISCGGEVERGLSLPDISGTARAFEILNPPTPRGVRSFAGGCDGWHRRIGYVGERAATILLWNPSDRTADVPLAPADVARLGCRFHVWSFWDGRYLGVQGPDFVAKDLPPHGPALLRLTALAEVPVVVGSTLHITAGEAEVAGFEGDGTEWTLRLTHAGAREGTLAIASERQLCVVRAVGLDVTACERCGAVWTVSVARRRRGGEQSITLREDLQVHLAQQ